MNDDNLPYYNFDYCDWTVIRIIRKYYPFLKKEEMNLLARVAWTMKDFNWSVAPALEVESRMTENPILEESDIDAAPPANLLLPREYKDILSHLIGTKILQQEIIPTKYGSPPTERLENEEYLVFTNNDMINEILRNSEALDLAVQYFVRYLA
jgi:hypothetical protein